MHNCAKIKTNSVFHSRVLKIKHTVKSQKRVCVPQEVGSAKNGTNWN
jgi:hypothetical protein